MDDITKTQCSFARKALTQPDHRFEDLYHHLCREEWVRRALQFVLDNSGSRTPGVDGVTRRSFASESYTDRFIADLIGDLKAGVYRPEPARRIFLPKPNGTQRPIGIATLRDRVVQMLLKLLMEPIWESDFLDCSSGFRPGRRTMDCIAMCYRLIQEGTAYFWTVEGDIVGCFDHVQHDRLLALVARRIHDRRVLRLIEAFLTAGVMEGTLFQKTAEGTPQGGIASPLWANIYLHELDRYWWEHYGQLSQTARHRRREQGVGNCRLLRYADDFVLLTNGPRTEAERLRGEVQQVLQDRLKLALSPEKTRVTHATEGFDFLGFHIRRYERPKGGGKPVTLVTPSAKSVARLKAKIRHMTRHNLRRDNPYLKLVAVNQVLRGWIGYYQHVNAKAVADQLDWWVSQRMAHWLVDHHQCGIREVLRRYQVEDQGRKNFAVTNGEGRRVPLYLMCRQPITRYIDRKRTNPYLGPGPVAPVLNPEEPDLDRDHTWNGSEAAWGWRATRAARLAVDEEQCTRCGATENLQVHHRRQRRWNQRQDGNDDLAGLRSLCRRCHRERHRQTPAG
jgi:group II intron reverse transcriptase/maturase